MLAYDIPTIQAFKVNISLCTPFLGPSISDSILWVPECHLNDYNSLARNYEDAEEHPDIED